MMPWADAITMNVALPRLMANFALDVEGGSWVLNSGLLAMAVTMPATGWLVSRFGMTRLFIGALAMFVLALLMISPGTLRMLPRCQWICRQSFCG